MKKYNIPTARYEIFTDVFLAKSYIEKNNKYPIVIKADGLASGKGVFIAEKKEDALDIIDNLLINNKLSDSGKKIVIEDFLDGLEASFIVMVDGENILPMATSQDHKRLLDNDLGPNTGGMGAYSPTPIVTDEIHKKVMDKIVLPTINNLKKEGHFYVGFLYVGLMIDKEGNPYVVEFNCRFGDPETQPIMVRLESDFDELIFKALNKELSKVEVKWNQNYAIGIVLASKGYPDNVKTGDIINGLDNVSSDIKIFYAGTRQDNNNIVTSGGRVLCVVGLAKNISKAKEITYNEIKKINFEGMQYRKDIGDKIL